jgi:hypothetical protein
MNVPKAIRYAILIVILLAMIPPALIAQLRAVNSKSPRVHPILDMDNQPKFRAQHANPLFVDGRAMRIQVEDTVARGGLQEDDHLYLGVRDNAWATVFPPQVSVDMPLLERGRERFDIYCLPCHGAAGYGDGIVNKRAMELMNLGTNGTTQPVGQIYNSITNGVRTMPAYGSQIPVPDRWAIVAYVKALHRSQNAEEPGS